MIKQVEQGDLNKIVAVHKKCFPDSFSTHLGDKLLQKMYEEYYLDAPELFLFAEEESKAVGFVMGYYYASNNALDRFKEKNKLALAWKTLKLLIVFDKAAWNKIKSMFVKKGNYNYLNDVPSKTNTNAMADLLSICVLSEYRGCGIAKNLIDAYEEVVKENKMQVCTLTVSSENPRGIRFYEKNGYKIYRTAPGCQSYFKAFHEEEQ